ncbi:hypothetical protein [Sphaerotilus microaerophilus]|jgi:hypothetical protein|uniref:Uncharacterized protein n=1 Tax=Sphaerotilus microaerophilus TaxID=2914710 RepID=A0ABM7YG66_9BURK|nr:hypothetical protein [Sphaerotilus sp. FB-5]BDI03159.1 hypothetical protein CATMQ487_01290 [Sphaerotilus sp. FB-5]
MVGTYETGWQAYNALGEECKKNVSSTKRTRKAVAKAVGGATGEAVVVALASVVPIVLPLFVELLLEGGKGVVGAVEGGRAKTTMEDGDDREALRRDNIQSILFGAPLLSVVGPRPGTHGRVWQSELMALVMIHYRKAHEIWAAEPFPAGKAVEGLASCHDAELLYRKHVEVDYHLSKMKAYAEELQKVASKYVEFCNKNSQTLQKSFKMAEGAAKAVMEHDERWHQAHCGVAEHCYRTTKWLRL